MWRCAVIDVVSGQRRYLDDLEAIGPYIREQVEGNSPVEDRRGVEEDHELLA